MNINPLFIILLLFPTSAFCQSFNPEIISSSGDSYSQINAKLDVTIGEPIIESCLNSNVYLTQGFQQGNLFVTQIPENNSNFNEQIEIYPNPTSNEINISSTTEDSILIYLYDLNGKMLKSEIMQKHLILDLSSYTSGSYLLKFIIDDKSKTYIVQKIK